MKTVTHGPWCVSTIGSGHPYGLVLNVFRGPIGRKFRRGDHDGKHFLNPDLASLFCLERGYTEVYRDSRAPVRKAHAPRLADLHAHAREATETAKTLPDLIDRFTHLSRQVGDLFNDPIAKCHWFNGYFAMARNLRPDLFTTDQ